MDLWDKLCGYYVIRVTSPEPDRLPDALNAAGVRIWDVQKVDPLTLELSIQAKCLGPAQQVAQRIGATVLLKRINGLTDCAKKITRHPLLFVTALLLLAAWWVASACVLNVCVEGNTSIPSALILETAEDLGFGFGARTASVNSEIIKNRILERVPELEWVGINITGCRACIQVRERSVQKKTEGKRYCNVVSGSDCVIDGIEHIAGDLLCADGQAVSEGQILVSGFQDLGICTRAVEARAEIYGLTSRENCCVLPVQILSGTENGESTKKISLIIGKKRINLYSDSGILMPGCGKMTEIKWLRIFDAVTLPIALVTDVYTGRELQPVERASRAAELCLQQAANDAVAQRMIAGVILSAQPQLQQSDSLYVLHTKFDCRELIGVQKDVVFWEGDKNDHGTNGQR